MNNQETPYTKNKFLSVLLLVLLALLLFVPLSQTNWYKAAYAFSPRIAEKIKTLTGSDFSWSFIPPNPPLRAPLAQQPLTINYTNFTNGSFQKRFEDYFMRGSSLWGWMVRTSNQIAYSLFSQITLSYGPPAFVGNEDQLLQPMYLNAFNHQKTLRKKFYKKRVKKLLFLQKLLAQHNVKLLIAISPNAMQLYPELLPKHYIDPTRSLRKNSYEYMLSFLNAKGVNYVDNYQILSDLKNEFPYRFFEKNGAHWNSVGSCIATNNIVERMSHLTGRKIDYLACSPVTYHEITGDDADLLEVANLLFPERYKQPAPYIPEGQVLYDKPPLRVLIIGTSFNFAILDHLNESHIADTKFLFYYKSLYVKSKQAHIFDKAKIDWQNDILKNDVIILEANYSNIGSVGLGFVDDALRVLRKSKKKKKSNRRTRKQISR